MGARPFGKLAHMSSTDHTRRQRDFSASPRDVPSCGVAKCAAPVFDLTLAREPQDRFLWVVLAGGNLLARSLSYLSATELSRWAT